MHSARGALFCEWSPLCAIRGQTAEYVSAWDESWSWRCSRLDIVSLNHSFMVRQMSRTVGVKSRMAEWGKQYSAGRAENGCLRAVPHSFQSSTGRPSCGKRIRTHIAMGARLVRWAMGFSRTRFFLEFAAGGETACIMQAATDLWARGVRAAA